MATGPNAIMEKRARAASKGRGPAGTSVTAPGVIMATDRAEITVIDLGATLETAPGVIMGIARAGTSETVREGTTATGPAGTMATVRSAISIGNLVIPSPAVPHPGTQKTDFQTHPGGFYPGLFFFLYRVNSCDLK